MGSEKAITNKSLGTANFGYKRGQEASNDVRRSEVSGQGHTEKRMDQIQAMSGKWGDFWGAIALSGCHDSSKNR